jgi:hypothetical protein
MPQQRPAPSATNPSMRTCTTVRPSLLLAKPWSASDPASHSGTDAQRIHCEFAIRESKSRVCTRAACAPVEEGGGAVPCRARGRFSRFGLASFVGHGAPAIGRRKQRMPLLLPAFACPNRGQPCRCAGSCCSCGGHHRCAALLPRGRKGTLHAGLTGAGPLGIFGYGDGNATGTRRTRKKTTGK